MDTNYHAKETRRVERHYHAKDLMEALLNAKNKRQPVYASDGPCGGCDIIISPIVLDADRLLQKLRAVDPTRPIYPCEHAPCGGCDLCLPCEDGGPRPKQ
ncbi:MAG: hypothetical protein HXS48_06785 [Theionarchaea archaeon]|nr:hypothetical protein [Theionarchaea archaeon]